MNRIHVFVFHRHSFARKILMGLMFSCLGDAFLIWPSHFPHGMAAFGIAQVNRLQAFSILACKMYCVISCLKC